MDRLTTLGLFIGLLIAWAPDGLIERGRQAATPTAPFTSLAR